MTLEEFKSLKHGSIIEHKAELMGDNVWVNRYTVAYITESVGEIAVCEDGVSGALYLKYQDCKIIKGE